MSFVTGRRSRFLGLSFLGLLISAATIAPAPSRAEVILYDPGLGTLPGSQGWIAGLEGDATQSLSGGRLILDTSTTRADRGGYFSENPFTGGSQHPQIPVLDRQTGYRVGFGLQVLSESHAARDDNSDGKDDRAGFSFIAISEDLWGIEVAFWQDRIWVYADANDGADALFTQAEGVDFDTTADFLDYELWVQGDGYRLTENGATLLSGNLRNYNPNQVNALINPYDNPSFLFFGDNTTSADSSVALGSVRISSVPEPSAVGFLLVGLLLVASVRWARRIANRNSACLPA